MVTLHIDGTPITLENVIRSQDRLSFTLNGASFEYRFRALSDGGVIIERQESPGIQRRMHVISWQGKNERHVQWNGLEATISELAKTTQNNPELELSPRAPMPGLIRQILVTAGQRIEKGQPLAVMEAMKLQTTLSAGASAIVEAILVKEGEMVSEGAELVRLKETNE